MGGAAASGPVLQSSFMEGAASGGAPSLTASTTVRVLLTDANDAPTVSDTSVSVNENSDAGTAVGSASATDPDLRIEYLVVGGGGGGGSGDPDRGGGGGGGAGGRGTAVEIGEPAASPRIPDDLEAARDHAPKDLSKGTLKAEIPIVERVLFVPRLETGDHVLINSSCI